MNKPNNKRKKDSIERIEKTFLNLIQNNDIKDITISKICKFANINRTTFYANYIDIYDLIDKIRDRMLNEFANIFDNEDGHTRENYLKMFNHIKNNQVFYKTYFKLNFDTNYKIDYYDKELAKKMYNDQFIEYHSEFFKAGITAIIKMWLNNNCKEKPEDILKILESEYKNKFI